MPNSEYLFDSAMKNLIYGLVRIDPLMRIADKNSAARKYTFLPRIGSTVQNICGKYIQKLYEVRDGIRKAAVISFSYGEKTVYAAVFKEDNECLLMVFHPLLFFVGGSVNEAVLEKAVSSCAGKLAAILKYSDLPKKPGRNIRRQDHLIRTHFAKITERSDAIAEKMRDAISYFDVIDSSAFTVMNAERHKDAFIDTSKLFYAFVEIISFSNHILNGNRLVITADFEDDFLAVTVSGNIEHRITPSQRLYFEIFATVMHCMGIGAKILRSREKHFEAAISIPYEPPRTQLYGIYLTASELPARFGRRVIRGAEN